MEYTEEKVCVGGDVHFHAIGSLHIRTRRERLRENGLEFTLGFKEGQSIFHKIPVTLAPFSGNELTAEKKQECLTLRDRSPCICLSLCLSVSLPLCVCAQSHMLFSETTLP